MKCPNKDLSCPYVDTSDMTKEKECVDCEHKAPEIKAVSLLRRFFWPIFFLTWGGALLAGIAYYCHNTELATVGFTICLFGVTVAVSLNAVDEGK